MLFDNTSFREGPSSNELGLMYLYEEHVDDYLTILLEFVNTKSKELQLSDDMTSFEDHILLAALFF